MVTTICENCGRDLGGATPYLASKPMRQQVQGDADEVMYDMPSVFCSEQHMAPYLARGWRREPSQ